MCKIKNGSTLNSFSLFSFFPMVVYPLAGANACQERLIHPPCKCRLDTTARYVYLDLYVGGGHRKVTSSVGKHSKGMRVKFVTHSVDR